MADLIVKEELTAAYLRELLSYSPETGVFTWRVSCRGTKAGDIAGTSGTEGRRHITVGGVRFKAHRLAWLYVHGAHPANQIDHINGDPTDNRIANLREATVAENQGNQRRAHSNNITGLLGAQKKHGRSNFRARITVSGKEIHLGHFASAELAHKAYLAAKAKYHAFGNIADGAEEGPEKSAKSDSSKSGIAGVKRVARAKTADKWEARISIGGIQYHLGTFDTAGDASFAYQAFKNSMK